jgi:hypothetical protein
MRNLRERIEAFERSPTGWTITRAQLEAAAFVAVMALVLFLVFLLPRLIGGVAGPPTAVDRRALRHISWQLW